MYDVAVPRRNDYTLSLLLGPSSVCLFFPAQHPSGVKAAGMCRQQNVHVSSLPKTRLSHDVGPYGDAFVCLWLRLHRSTATIIMLRQSKLANAVLLGWISVAVQPCIHSRLFYRDGLSPLYRLDRSRWMYECRTS